MALAVQRYIPKELWFASAKGQVMEIIKKIPVDGDTKVDLLVGWARLAGATVNASQRDAVRQTGVDRE